LLGRPLTLFLLFSELCRMYMQRAEAIKKVRTTLKVEKYKKICKTERKRVYLLTPLEYNDKAEMKP